MAMLPKVFRSRTTSRLRRLSSSSSSSSSVFSLVCLIFGIAGVLIGVFSVTGPSRECPDAKPRSVSVVWDRSGAGGGGLNDVGASKRHEVMAFVGIQTGFGSVGRREAIRQTWLSSDSQGLLRLEEATALAFRFVIGKTKDTSKMAALQKEVNVYDDFMLIDIEEEYNNLPHKTLAFFKTAFALYDSDFYVKADDDIYLRPDRLSLLLAKERMHTRTYLGCMKNGPVVTDPNMKWFEPLSHLFGEIYFLHAYGPIYALSADVVSSLVALRNDSFRMFSNEDVTIGSWMLAMNVNHENNHALCASECSSSSIAVWDIPRCSGLCNPEMKMLELHKKEICSGASASSDE